MRKGFSLVELSIVLVILGLLVGGILAGQSLIHASELRSASSDFQKYNTAFYAYRDKYFAVPGDHAAAFSFFGTNCAATALDCNGNGNGALGDSINATVHAESFRAYQELALAGLIAGQYTGVPTAPVVAGTNVPAARLNGGVFWAYSFVEDNYFATGGSTVASGVIHILLGAPVAGVTWPSATMMLPADAWNIDTKLDDGRPGTGRMIGGHAASGCSDTAVRATAAYSLNSTAMACLLLYRI